MRRSWSSRALAALFAVWFTVFTVEPAVVHACDVHDAARSAEAATTHAHDMQSAHAEHAVSSPEAEQPGDGTSCCTCPDDCAAASPAALATTTTSIAVVTTATTDTGLPDHEYVPVAAAHVLPFANGPPTRV